MTDKITNDDIDRHYHLLRTDPEQLLELTSEFVAQRPNDSYAYFVRHQAWEGLALLELALADLEKSIVLEDCYVAREARGRILHRLGRYGEAADAYNSAEQFDPARWKGGFGPLFRADSYAHLGNEAAALADCDTLPDDHWTPGLFGAPAGTRDEVADELRRRAGARREG